MAFERGDFLKNSNILLLAKMGLCTDTICTQQIKYLTRFKRLARLV
jgi:hypothetical protein